MEPETKKEELLSIDLVLDNYFKDIGIRGTAYHIRGLSNVGYKKDGVYYPPKNSSTEIYLFDVEKKKLTKDIDSVKTGLGLVKVCYYHGSQVGQDYNTLPKINKGYLIQINKKGDIFVYGWASGTSVINYSFIENIYDAFVISALRYAKETDDSSYKCSNCPDYSTTYGGYLIFYKKDFEPVKNTVRYINYKN